MSDVFHTEDLGLQGDCHLVFVETKDREMPIPSDVHIRNVFRRTQPDMELRVARRDDVRHSAVLSLPAVLPWEKIVLFVQDLGMLSGC